MSMICHYTGCTEQKASSGPSSKYCAYHAKLAAEETYAKNQIQRKEKREIDRILSQQATSLKFLDVMNAYLKENGGVYYRKDSR